MSVGILSFRNSFDQVAVGWQKTATYQLCQSKFQGTQWRFAKHETVDCRKIARDRHFSAVLQSSSAQSRTSGLQSGMLGLQ